MAACIWASLPEPALALRGKVETLKRVSGASPFPNGCGRAGQQTKDSEGEPHIAVNPRDPNNILVTWQQDRFEVEGGALSNLIAATKDGGKTWRQVRLPNLSACTGGVDDRTSDPWLAIGPDGTAYMGSLTFIYFPEREGLAAPTQQYVNTSTDGGFTFSDPVQIVADGEYNDREAITADPTRPSHAYHVWARRFGTFGESGNIHFARTADGGRSWTAPRTIHVPPPSNPPLPTIISVLPDGALLNFFMQTNPSPVVNPGGPAFAPFRVMVMRSDDQGDTWSAPLQIGQVDRPVAPKDPDSGALVRAYPLVSPAVAPDGTAYVAWNEIVANDQSHIYISRSTDGGRTWSGRSAAASPKTQAFIPALAIDGRGVLALTWDDFRNDKPGDGKLTTDVWFAHSHDRGESWTETHLDGPFDMLTAAPTASTQIQGRFIGDYQGLAPLPRGFVAAFAQAQPKARTGPADVFFAKLATDFMPRIALSVSPRSATSGEETTFRFRATFREGGQTEPVAGARVRFCGESRTTDRKGRARVKVACEREGRVKARASKSGFRSGIKRVRLR